MNIAYGTRFVRSGRLLNTILLATSVVASGILGGCYTNPTTGRRQFEGISRDQEIALGAAEAPKMVAEMGGEVQNPALRQYITEVGMRLKDHTESDGPQRQWYFTLIDSDEINAFAMPGERVFMSRGLSDKLVNEAQLAGVLGHEIGHVMARHVAERIGQSQAAQAGVGIAGIFLGNTEGGAAAGQVLSQGAGLWLLKYSRDQEREADMLGVRYMVKAGYNPIGQRQVMEVLQKASTGGGQPEMLSTHPLPATRIADMDRLISGEYAFTQSGPDAGKYQLFAERYQQRYLAVRAAEPKRAAPPRKRAASPTDAHGRIRMLAAFNVEDPLSWCTVCIAAADRGEPLHIHMPPVLPAFAPPVSSLK